MAAPNYPYRALRDIDINGVRAFNTGDLIPAGHTENPDLGLAEGTDYEAVPAPLPQYDPGEYTVDEVQAYLATADEAEVVRVIGAETVGKNRSGITG